MESILLYLIVLIFDKNDVPHSKLPLYFMEIMQEQSLDIRLQEANYFGNGTSRAY